MRSLLFLVLFVVFARAVSANPIDTSFTQHLKPSLDVHRLSGAISIDGNLDDDGWKQAAHVSDFTAALPVPNARPTEKTEGYIAYDNDYLYIAMIAHDTNPSAIRASKVARDRIWDDDFMGIILDTYGDATKTFELHVNPYGIQGDLFWSSTNEDESYDMIFDAESKITSDGWQMEMRIPFRSLRFPDIEKQNFRMTFWRNYPRESDYKFSWAPINFQIPCMFCQLGSLTGIEGVHSAGMFEFLPSLVATQSAELVPDVLQGTRLANQKPEVRPSLNARIALGTATAIEAAIKPDFSQVEADAAQVSANSTFALYYPERRPFFQDGGDLWNTFMSAVYTRSMNSPIVAAKALHRDDASSYAFLSSYDENTPIILPLEERSVTVYDDHKSLSNIFRATHTFGDDRYFGVLATDRRYTANGANSVAGIDGRFRLFENVVLQGQQLFSVTREPDSGSTDSTRISPTRFDHGQHTLNFDGERFNGSATVVALERMTQSFDAHAEYGLTSPDYRAGDGFVTQNGFRYTEAWIGDKYILRDAPDWLKWMIEVDGSFEGQRTWDYDGVTKQEYLRPGLDFALTGQTNLHIKYKRTSERFSGVIFPDLYNVNVFGSTKFMQSVAFSWNVRSGRAIYYDPAAPSMGRELNVALSATLKPMDALTFSPSVTYSRLDSLSGNGSYYKGAIYWAKLGYQFTREMDLRVIAQYDGFGRQFIVDPLLTYKLNPFTCFYLGSAHGFLAMDGTPLEATNRQFFAKLQYLIQA
jgi:hypothetical protein